MNPWLLTLSLAYLLGSIPFGYLLVRLVRKEDIREVGSGNIGATNVLRSGAKGLGIATLLLDLLKGYAAVLIARHVAPANYDLAVAAAVAAVLGHVFPVWLGFRGGKGVATALGVFLALVPPAAALVALSRLPRHCPPDPLRLAGLDPRGRRNADCGPRACAAALANCRVPASSSSALLIISQALTPTFAGCLLAQRIASVRLEEGVSREPHRHVLGAGAWGTAIAISLRATRWS